MILVDYDGVVSDGTVYQLPVHFCHVSFMIRRMYCYFCGFLWVIWRPWLGLANSVVLVLHFNIWFSFS